MRISDWSSDVCSSDLCFSRDDMIGMETVFGLIDYPNVPGGEGSVQFTCDRQTPIAFPVEFIAIPFPTLAARPGPIAGQQSAAPQILFLGRVKLHHATGLGKFDLPPANPQRPAPEGRRGITGTEHGNT